MHKGWITEENDANPLGTAGYWAAGQGRQQGGAYMQATEAVRENKGPSDGRTPGADRT